MKYEAKTPEVYIAQLPEARRMALSKLRESDTGKSCIRLKNTAAILYYPG